MLTLRLCFTGIREVFVTYPDDKPVMKYVFQLLDNLQRNNFRTSADEKHKDEKTPEKIIRRFHRVSMQTDQCKQMDLFLSMLCWLLFAVSSLISETGVKQCF